MLSTLMELFRPTGMPTFPGQHAHLAEVVLQVAWLDHPREGRGTRHRCAARE